MRRNEKVTDPPTGAGFARLGLDFFVTFVGRYATLSVVVAILQQNGSHTPCRPTQRDPITKMDV
jgi:hypothetical protein